jgi:c(7)-type cytochrome triheme protein
MKGFIRYFNIALVGAVAGFAAWSFTVSAGPDSVQVAQAEKKKAEPKKKVSPVIDPADPTSVIYLDTAGKIAGTGDPSRPASEAWRAGLSWHPQALAAAGVPKDRYGLVDWARSARENLINPKHSLDPQAEEMPPLDMDIVIPAKGLFVPDVTYPHAIHTYWLSCDGCHPAIFQPARGENKMTMVAIANGQFCGRCHGKVAFPLTDCSRCHNVPKKGVKK